MFGKIINLFKNTNIYVYFNFVSLNSNTINENEDAIN